jgi:hypothetical protein
MNRELMEIGLNVLAVGGTIALVVGVVAWFTRRWRRRSSD